jgi:dihydrofolate reductase
MRRVRYNVAASLDGFIAGPNGEFDWIPNDPTGGGELFATLLAAGQVDDVEVTVVPILLGKGVPLLPGGAQRTTLALTRSHVYPSVVGLHYAVENAGA